MIHPAPFTERVLKAFRPGPCGVVGLVDDLLGLCRVHQLRIDFRDGHCAVRRLGSDVQESLEIEVPKSVFRAAVSRIAAICNEQHPRTVTPYRGAGDIVLQEQTGDSPSTCHVTFANTPSEQYLEMRFCRGSFGEGNRFTVLLRDGRTVFVQGHALTFVENASNQPDHGSYGILSRSSGTEVLVAVFRAVEVVGVFSGELNESEQTVAASEAHSEMTRETPRTSVGGP
jgi:hypothetical protein